jgi:hypothetical protein
MERFFNIIMHLCHFEGSLSADKGRQFRYFIGIVTRNLLSKIFSQEILHFVNCVQNDKGLLGKHNLCSRTIAHFIKIANSNNCFNFVMQIFLC